MRRLFAAITTKLNLRTAVLSVSVLVAVATIPVSVWAWGPARTTFTMEHPASYVTFNSITDNPTYGDERNFMRVREEGASASTYTDTMQVVPGKRYVVMMFYHNNASSSYNASGKGIAHGAYARAAVPAIVKNGASSPAEGYVGASNANPTYVYDEVNFKNNSGNDIALRYVPGSTSIHSFGAVNNKTLPDTVLTSSGVKLGYDSLNGDLPGCNDYSGYILFTVQADQPNFTFNKQVRAHKSGDYQNGWKDSLTAKPGSKVDYLLSYKNTGTVLQTDVVFKDVLPKGLKYVKGSSVLITGSNPTGKAVNDSISQGGINVGDYNPKAAAYLVFSATVGDLPCTKLVNKADVETDNGGREDSATVVTGEKCTLPTTGPVEVIASFVGIAAITFGAVYYFKSRRDLSEAIHDVQLHPTHTMSVDADTAEKHEHHDK